MEKLELKHLAGYLPYGLKFLPTHYNPDKRIDTLYYLSTMNSSEEFAVNGYTSNYIKPILRPLSDLTKEIEHNGEKFVPLDLLNKTFRPESKDLVPYVYSGKLEVYIETEDYSQTINLMDGFYICQKLIEWHFDIHGGIGKWAIDINTLK